MSNINTHQISQLIDEFRVLKAKDSITPEALGEILQRIVNLFDNVASDGDMSQLNNLINEIGTRRFMSNAYFGRDPQNRTALIYDYRDSDGQYHHAYLVLPSAESSERGTISNDQFNDFSRAAQRIGNSPVVQVADIYVNYNRDKVGLTVETQDTLNGNESLYEVRFPLASYLNAGLFSTKQFKHFNNMLNTVMPSQIVHHKIPLYGAKRGCIYHSSTVMVKCGRYFLLHQGKRNPWKYDIQSDTWYISLSEFPILSNPKGFFKSVLIPGTKNLVSYEENNGILRLDNAVYQNLSNIAIRFETENEIANPPKKLWVVNGSGKLSPVNLIVKAPAITFNPKAQLTRANLKALKSCTVLKNKNYPVIQIQYSKKIRQRCDVQDKSNRRDKSHYNYRTWRDFNGIDNSTLSKYFLYCRARILTRAGKTPWVYFKYRRLFNGDNRYTMEHEKWVLT